MALLYLNDILKNAGLDPKKTLLIRHSKTHESFKRCYENGMLKEYTQVQKHDFTKGYDYWVVFVSSQGTTAVLEGCYKVNGYIAEVADKSVMPDDYPVPEMFEGGYSFFDLEKTDLLKEMEGRLIINWGKSTIAWKQKALNEKEVLAIQANKAIEFVGYDKVILTFSQLRQIVENKELYSDWHVALSSVSGIYLILDKKSGKQYIGSAGGENGILGRWTEYVETKHGGNKLLKKLLQEDPDRYKDFQYSLLQVIHAQLEEKELVDIEKTYKKKLGTKVFGLNDN